MSEFVCSCGRRFEAEWGTPDARHCGCKDPKPDPKPDPEVPRGRYINLTIGGVRRTLDDWCRLYRVPYDVALDRYRRGEAPEVVVCGDSAYTGGLW